MPISFRTAAGQDMHGDVHGWDGDGFYGTFGRITWTQLEAAEAWHVHAAIIDPEMAAHWLNVGRVLSTMEDGEVYADRALRWAAWLGQYTADAANQIRAGLPPTPPGSDPPAPPVPWAHRNDAGPHDPWPAMTDEEQAAATEQLKNEVKFTLEALQVPMLLYEQEYALVYSDMPQEAVTSMLVGMRLTYLSLLLSFDLPTDRNIFWGKLVVFICNDYETFSRLHADAFYSGTPPQGMAGVFIPEEEKSFLLIWNFPDVPKLKATVPHEFTHAFMHRYRSPALLPRWLDEGFADLMASLVMENSPVEEARRPLGEWFIRHGGPVDNILAIQCMHDGFPGPFASLYTVGYVLVSHMYEAHPEGLVACLKAIKGGKPWEQALIDHYGQTREQLVAEVTRRVMAPDPDQVRPDDEEPGGSPLVPGSAGSAGG